MDYLDMNLEQLEMRAEELKMELYNINIAISEQRSKKKEKAWDNLVAAIFGYFKYEDRFSITWEGGHEMILTKQNINIPHTGEIFLEFDEEE